MRWPAGSWASSRPAPAPAERARAPPHRPTFAPRRRPAPQPYRFPYGLRVPLDGRATAPIRPYVLAAERECARRRRRIAQVLAADFGIDLDRHVVGAERAA